MGFGKRPSSNASARERGVHGRERVIPAEVWEGETGQFLRELGFSPDDENNLVPNKESIEERLEQGRAAVEARLMRANDEIAKATRGGSLRPFYLIPDACWNGVAGQFLMAQLDLYPYDDWNVALLPADEHTAYVLGAPLHPNGNIPAFERAALEFMAREEANLREAHAETGPTHDLARFGEVREQVRNRVRGFAAFLLAELTKAWRARHAPARAH